MVIDNRGLVPDADVEVFRQFGAKQHEIYSAKIASTSGAGSTLTLSIPSGAAPNMIVLMEDQTCGERVRKFDVEALIESRWTTVWQGACMGHKRIERFAPQQATELRLTISESIAESKIREFSAWRT
jgi:alpha-L-fucosidase